MMRRIATVSTAAAVASPLAASVASAPVHSTSGASLRSFSTYGDQGNYKAPGHVGGRSGAHRRPEKQNYPPRPRPVAAEADAEVEAQAEEEADDDGSGHAEMGAPRRFRSRYQDLYKPKQQAAISFTSNFKPKADEDDIKDAGLTKIYSHEEVVSMGKVAAKPASKPAGKASRSKARRAPAAAATAEEYDDVLRVLEEEEEDDGGAVVSRVYVAAAEEEADAVADNVTVAATTTANNDLEEEEEVEMVEVEVDGPQHTAAEESPAAELEADDKFDAVRSHPFYADLIKRVDKNMGRHRKDVRHSGRYSEAAVNDCVRPLLQLADYPFTTREISQLAPSIVAKVLTDTLSGRSACRRMHVFRSPDTDLVLDWSIEDFLRRRYESVHMSWEPMDVVVRRFGWSSETVSDRDILVYFGEFDDFIEMAELEFAADGRPRAVPIADPFERADKAPVPASRLLVRRVPDAGTELSITEAIRLMGAPAFAGQERKGGAARHGRSGPSESVAEMFSAVERAAADVAGDDTAKLSHGMDSARSLRQATSPGGRMISEFSIGKRAKEEPAAAAKPQNIFTGKRAVAAAGEDGEELNADLDGHGATAPLPEHYDAGVFEALSNAFHKTKVEMSMLRRRMMSSGSPGRTQAMEARLAAHCREHGKLQAELKHLSALRRQEQIAAEEGSGAEAGQRSAGAAAPSNRPRYMEAPETDPKKVTAAADGDEDDIDILRELQEYAEMYNPNAAAKIKAGAEEEVVESYKPRGHHQQQVAEEKAVGADFKALAEDDDYAAQAGDLVDVDDGDAYIAGLEEPRSPTRRTAPRSEADEVAKEAVTATAAEDGDDDDIDISAAMAEYEADLQRPRLRYGSAPPQQQPHAAPASSTMSVHKKWTSRTQPTPTPIVARTPAPTARGHEAAKPEEVEVEEVEADAGEDRDELVTFTNNDAAMEAADEPAAAEALVDPAELADDFAALEDDDAAEQMPPMTRGEELALAVERCAAATAAARAELARLVAEKGAADAAMARSVEQASGHVAALEAALAAATQAHREAVDGEARAAAEASARKVERQLEAQRERRLEEVARQREQARLAQAEANRAVSRQQELEAEALEMERELEQKLAAVRAQLRATRMYAAAEGVAEVAAAVEEEEIAAPAADAELGDYDAEDVDESSPTAAAAPAEEKVEVVAVEEPRHEAATEAEEPTVAAEEEEPAARAPVDPNSPVFMCSPDQYDGLYLAAIRLRTEISALEKQMEQEGDEDDETLMAVLAESRADLEELDDCILSVKHNASWAAERDARRERESAAAAGTVDTEAQRLQDKIDAHRFQIGLLEKRLPHSSKRTVSTKLEQGIIAARREIAALRREQDRLRLEGRGAFGLPASVSIAETLGKASRDRELRKREAEAAMHAAVAGKDRNASADETATATSGEREEMEVEKEEDNKGPAAAAFQDDDDYAYESASATDAAAEDGEADEIDDVAAAAAVADIDSRTAAAAAATATGADPEAHRLRLRLDSMLHDIQHLQDNIAVQERTSDYDDEETEAVLVEMKNKLGQLLQLRTAVQQRLAEGGPAPSAPVAAHPGRSAGAMLAAAESGEGKPRMDVRSFARFRPAAKKLRKMARANRK